MIGFTLFDTPLGRCGLVWRDGAVHGFQLPEQDSCATGARLRHRFPDARAAKPDRCATDVIDRVLHLFGSGTGSFADVTLDLMTLPHFERAVLQATAAIPPGETRTYGEIARAVGDPGRTGGSAAQAVGRALGRNPMPVIVPCHRVVGADGRLVGFSAPGGVTTKRRLLALEGAAVAAQGILF